MQTKPSRRTSRISDIDAEIERLRERRKQVIMKDNERFARAAIKAGLAELDIPDDALDAAFAEMAARFRKGRAKPSSTPGGAD
ncbi:TraC family protein [Rhizobium sp. PP-F2F-G48]|uniref:TraC family protein n=1 Tax=Rhizobium sp. PP-F2F-G48 TaxID=2135651 RepID=UPI00104F73EC|nr:TraC family protein [Rhizobium sp. PP-F2F-G48]